MGSALLSYNSSNYYKSLFFLWNRKKSCSTSCLKQSKIGTSVTIHITEESIVIISTSYIAILVCVCVCDMNWLAARFDSHWFYLGLLPILRLRFSSLIWLVLPVLEDLHTPILFLRTIPVWTQAYWLAFKIDDTSKIWCESHYLLHIQYQFRVL